MKSREVDNPIAGPGDSPEILGNCRDGFRRIGSVGQLESTTDKAERVLRIEAERGAGLYSPDSAGLPPANQLGQDSVSSAPDQLAGAEWQLPNAIPVEHMRVIEVEHALVQRAIAQRPDIGAKRDLIALFITERFAPGVIGLED